MRFRIPETAAIAGLLVLAAANTVQAQPVAPPPRPTFSSYYGLFRPGVSGAYLGYGGVGTGLGFGYGYPGIGFGYGAGLGAQMRQQNLMLQQQLNLTNQNISNLQTFLATGVNPNLGVTGHGVVFNNLGHWYPSAPNGGGGGGGTGGGIVAPRSAMPLSGTGGAGGPGAMGGGAQAGPRTAGSGIPLGPRR